jgi:hypothetical protein
MVVKVFYDPNTYEVLAEVPVDGAAGLAGFPFVVCGPDDLTVEKETPEEGVIIPRRVFPFNDLQKLKTIAHKTVEHWRTKKQASGYTHNNVTYATDESSRGLLLGKIQEMKITGATTGIFPDIHGNPVSHTQAELEAVGVAVAHFIEGVYQQYLGHKAQIDNASDLSDLEAVIVPLQGEL